MVDNQINHREEFRKQVAAGNTDLSNPKRHQGASNVVPPKRKQPAKGENLTVAELIGMEKPADAPVAAPLSSTLPPPTANVDTELPAINVDPKEAEGEAPPAFGITASNDDRFAANTGDATEAADEAADEVADQDQNDTPSYEDEDQDDDEDLV